MTLSSFEALTVSAFGGGSGFSIWGFTRFFSSTSVSLRRRTNSIFGGAWIASSLPLAPISTRSNQNNATVMHQAEANASGSRSRVKGAARTVKPSAGMVDWVRFAGEVGAVPVRPAHAPHVSSARRSLPRRRVENHRMKPKVDRFAMERMQCLYENEVELNLSESGVWPLSLGELLADPSARAALDERPIKYPHSTGRRELRENIARFHGGADPDAVMVTNGGSEANYTALWGLVEKRERVAFMLPNYLQGWGLARAWGKRADGFGLVPDRQAHGVPRWRLDLDALARAVRPDTRVIVVTNPNNPTGSVLSEPEMDAIVAAARRVGAWIVSDEIYRGAEVAGPLTPTFWGRYARVVVTGGLSKAFGLPGLRTGWILAPPALIRRLCHYHDYLTLTPSFLSEHLADL